ncbi:iron-containing alcohol dehydrogenase family protein [Coprothermobacter platensis]|uniref:iron-containing alcohol dehydrogenase family protein n=1 Tax=Coprothermobacter platensis TaxID=108819 RepID=UPI000381BB54|nr:iron-containing alcohol dehydrogenase [Coprothermobacter platensis]
MFFQSDLNHIILFGEGSLDKLRDYVAPMGHGVFLVTGKSAKERGLLDKLNALLNGLDVIHFDNVSPNPKAEEVDEALSLIKTMGKPVDVVVAVGGGSVLDFAKAVAAAYSSHKPLTDLFGINMVPSALPIVAAPTTHGTGSEVTKYSVITHEHQKKTISDEKIVPKVAIVDPELTYSMPANVAIDTTLDALSHLTEAYFSALSNPITDAFVEKGMQFIAPHLNNLDNMNKQAHEDLSLASLLGGLAINVSGSGIAHAMGYPLTTEFDIPHGRANAILMPVVFKFNAEVRPQHYERLAKMLNADDLSTFLSDLRTKYGISDQIKNITWSPSLLNKWADQVVNNKRLMNSACRKPNADEVIQLYKEAFGI